jgi:hypothetical protein
MNSKIALAITAAALVADSVGTRIKARRTISELNQGQIVLVDMLAMKQAQIQYLCSVLDANDIVLTEFDQIAFNNSIGL